MLVGLLFIMSRVVISQTFTQGAKRCDGILKRIDCWGPSDDSNDNICLWNSGDGECNPESMDDMEKLCETFMQQSTCENRDLCVWNAADFKCQNDEGAPLNEGADNFFWKDCTKITLKTGCRGYAGRGQECRWVASTSSCANGYFGNMDFHCGAFDTECEYDGACMMANGVCVSREGHPNSGANTVATGGTSQGTAANINRYNYGEYEAPEAPEPEEPQEAESPTLEKGNPLLSKERDYTAGFWFLGVCGAILLFGAVVKVLFYKSSPSSREEALFTEGPEPILLNDGSALII